MTEKDGYSRKLGVLRAEKDEFLEMDQISDGKLEVIRNPHSSASISKTKIGVYRKIFIALLQKS